MARLVLCGNPAAPKYRELEALLDQLRTSLPDFHVVKRVVANANDEGPTIRSLNRKYGWCLTNLPVVWRELGVGNPAPALLGNAEATIAWVRHWYGLDRAGVSAGAPVEPSSDTEALRSSPATKSIRICIAGALLPTAYTFLFSLLSGDVFGETAFSLYLLDLVGPLEQLKGLRMEVEDCAFACCPSCRVTSDAKEAFAGADIVVILACETVSFEALEQQFKEYGQALEASAHAETQVVVAAPRACLLTATASAAAPSIPKTSFSYLSRLQQNRANACIVRQLNNLVVQPNDKIPGDAVLDVCVWGDPSQGGDSFLLDLDRAAVRNSRGLSGPHGLAKTSVRAMLRDDHFVEQELPEQLTMRSSLLASRPLMPAMSQARALSEHVKQLHTGTAQERMESMGVWTAGNPFGLRQDMYFSCPVVVQPGGPWGFPKEAGIAPGSALQTRLVALQDALSCKQTS